MLDAASKAKDRQVAFVSANIRQFGDGDGKLHPDLAAEAEKREVTVHYFRSLDDFAREHANRVTFVTHKWIMSRIPPEEVLDAAGWSMLSRGESILDNALESGESAAGEARMLNTSVGDIDWYVNELEDGTLRLEVIFSVEVEIEGPIWRSIWRQRTPRWYANTPFSDVWPEPVDFEIETERTATTRSLPFEVVVEGEIRAQELVEWEVTEVNDA